jgi:HAD superfamily hydrolase (TIGR01484 family)
LSAPWHRAKASDLARVVGICFDLDDTFTTDGRIAPAAWRALWSGHDAGLAMVAVTGRPAGWCDMISRFWPVAGVVGENGAFYYAYDRERRRVTRRYARSQKQRAEDRLRLEAVAEAVAKAVPRARIAADQPYRIADLAVDFAEDVGPLSEAEVRRIEAVFASHGATAKVSSIHVNGWFGRYDKRSMLLKFARERLKLDAAAATRGLVYVGDSPNDAPLFGAFPLSVGVANVRRFLPDLDAPPAYVTRRPEGEGFAEVVRRIVGARTAPHPGRR